jgi:hypothetical protein
MKPLSQHIQETLNNESLKEAFNEKLVDEELDALTRVSPQNKVKKKPTKSLVDSAVSGK